MGAGSNNDDLKRTCNTKSEYVHHLLSLFLSRHYSFLLLFSYMEGLSLLPNFCPPFYYMERIYRRPLSFYLSLPFRPTLSFYLSLPFLPTFISFLISVLSPFIFPFLSFLISVTLLLFPSFYFSCNWPHLILPQSTQG